MENVGFVVKDLKNFSPYLIVLQWIYNNILRVLDCLNALFESFRVLWICNKSTWILKNEFGEYLEVF